VAAQHAGRERPRDLQLACVVGGDLLELRVAMVGIISRRLETAGQHDLSDSPATARCAVSMITDNQIACSEAILGASAPLQFSTRPG
jgi:hypothetical protein